jgi:hypothetical protein
MIFPSPQGNISAVRPVAMGVSRLGETDAGIRSL